MNVWILSFSLLMICCYQLTLLTWEKKKKTFNGCKKKYIFNWLKRKEKTLKRIMKSATSVRSHPPVCSREFKESKCSKKQTPHSYVHGGFCGIHRVKRFVGFALAVVNIQQICTRFLFLCTRSFHSIFIHSFRLKTIDLVCEINLANGSKREKADEEKENEHRNCK